MDPRDIREELTAEAQDELLLVAAGYPMHEIGGALEKLSGYFQAIAICHFLESGEAIKFRSALMQSAYARRYFLRKSAEQGNDSDRRLALSRTEALFAAVAAGHLVLAAEIADRSIKRWEPNWEYEDDFCYFQFLHQIIQRPDLAGGPDSLTIVRRLEAALDDASSNRLRLAHSLIQRNELAFNDILVRLIEEQQVILEAKKERLLEPDTEAYLHWPRTYLSVEGLALVVIGQTIGLAADLAIPLCPLAARLPITNIDCEDFFSGIEVHLNYGGA